MKFNCYITIVICLLLASCKKESLAPIQVAKKYSCSFSIDVGANVKLAFPVYGGAVLSARVITNGHCDLNAFRWQWTIPNDDFVVEGQRSSLMVILDGPVGSYLFQVTAYHKNQLLRVPVSINVEMRG